MLTLIMLMIQNIYGVDCQSVIYFPLEKEMNFREELYQCPLRTSIICAIIPKAFQLIC